MRNYFRTACLSVAILSCSSILPAARPAEAGEPPAAAEEALPAQRAFVRLWHLPAAFNDVKGATVIGKRLYIAGARRGLEAVDAETGVPLWLRLGQLPLDFPPTELGKVLYIVEGGQLVALDRETGLTLTRANSKLGFLTPPYPGEGHCIVGSGDKGGYVYSVTTKTAVKLLRLELDDYPIKSTWDGESAAYFLTAKGTLYRVSIQSEDITWQHTFPNEFCSAPTQAEDSIYIGCADYYLYALAATTGSVQWKTVLSAPVLGQPLIAGPRVYAATTEKLIHAVDLKTHDDLWTVAGDRVLTTTPKHVVFLARNNTENWIGIADAATGQVISRATALQYVLFAAAPEGGVVYAIGKEGDVLAIADREAVLAGNAAKAREEAAEGSLMPPPAAPAVPPPPAAPAPAPSTAPEAPAPSTTPQPPPAPTAPAPAAPAASPPPAAPAPAPSAAPEAPAPAATPQPPPAPTAPAPAPPAPNL